MLSHCVILSCFVAILRRKFVCFQSREFGAWFAMYIHESEDKMRTLPNGSKVTDFKVRNWRLWLILGQNKPLFQAERSECGRCYILHILFVSLVCVDWEAL